MVSGKLKKNNGYYNMVEFVEFFCKIVIKSCISDILPFHFVVCVPVCCPFPAGAADN